MQLVKAICAIQFKDKLNVLSGFERIYKKLLKQEPDQSKNWLVPGFTLDDKNNKRSITIDAAKCAIIIEQPPNEGYCKNAILDFCNSVNKEYPLPPIARWGVRFYWIQDSDIEFSQLISDYKAKLYKNSALLEEVDDVGASFTVNFGSEMKMNIITGPMEKKQLQGLLSYPLESDPSAFIFVDTDLGSSKPTKYSGKFLGEFIDKSLNEGKTLAKKVIQLVEAK